MFLRNLKGKLVVIEGTDGSGKKTQTELLVKRLKKEGGKIATFSFPQYDQKSAGLVEEYLNGKYGPPQKVNPCAASLFYALDRFDLASKIRKLLKKKYTVIADRYVDSNAGHQGGKIKNASARIKFLRWLYNLEYKILGAPKPDLVLILRVPSKMGFRLIYDRKPRVYLQKNKSRDAHEADLNHLKAAETSYLWLAKKFPQDHKAIECLKKGKLLTPAEIHNKVYQTLKKYFGG